MSCGVLVILTFYFIYRHHTLRIKGEFVPYSPVSSRTRTKMEKLKVVKVVLQDVLTDLISGAGKKEFLDLRVDSFVESFSNFRGHDGTVDTEKCRYFLIRL